MRNLRRVTLIVAALSTVAIFSAACGGKKKHTPVNFSEPVGITLTAHKTDVTGGVLLVQKNINTESGNPFAKFVTDANTALNGNDPSSVSITSLVLTLSSSSSVTGLEQVFSNSVSIVFVMNGSTGSYPAGSIASVSGTAATMTSTFDTTSMTTADYQSFLGGQFKVALTGTAVPSFSTGNPNADMLATFEFAAFE